MMTRFGLFLALTLCLVFGIPVKAQTPAADRSSEAMHDVRRMGWQVATMIRDSLNRGDNQNFPGIKAWLRDLDKAAKGIDPKISPDKWPPVDLDALVTHNSNFWQAYYEIAPGDPGLNLLLGGLFLAVGESQRASNMLVVALQRPGIPKALQQALGTLLRNAQVYAQKSNELVARGAKLHDAGDYAGALKQYQAALALWPQNGLAYYEIGYTTREQHTVKAGGKKIPPNTVVVNEGPKNAPEVDAAFAKARRYDPFQLNAYQGGDPEVIRGFLALSKKGIPTWQKLTRNPLQKVEDDVLLDLANACQEAGIHDLALMTRQILVARRKQYAPVDHPFISTSLRKLSPGQQTEQVLKRLGTGTLALRQIVQPDPDEP